MHLQILVIIRVLLHAVIGRRVVSLLLGDSEGLLLESLVFLGSFFSVVITDLVVSGVEGVSSAVGGGVEFASSCGLSSLCNLGVSLLRLSWCLFDLCLLGLLLLRNKVFDISLNRFFFSLLGSLSFLGLGLLLLLLFSFLSGLLFLKLFFLGFLFFFFLDLKFFLLPLLHFLLLLSLLSHL